MALHPLFPDQIDQNLAMFWWREENRRIHRHYYMHLCFPCVIPCVIPVPMNSSAMLSQENYKTNLGVKRQIFTLDPFYSVCDYGLRFKLQRLVFSRLYGQTSIVFTSDYFSDSSFPRVNVNTKTSKMLNFSLSRGTSPDSVFKVFWFTIQNLGFPCF